MTTKQSGLRVSGFGFRDGNAAFACAGTRNPKPETRFSRLARALAALLLCVFCARAHAANLGEVELTREDKASVELALRFLASHQRPDGSFSGEMGDSTAIVAVGCLAWMCAGNLPGEGPYGKNVARGIQYILTYAQKSGLLALNGTGHAMYHHGLATIALAEAWGETADPGIYDKLKAAVELIVRTQNQRGGWRYDPHVGDDDLSMTVLQLLALRASKDAGVSVPKETIDRALRYVESCRKQDGFSYQPGEGKTWSTTAAGVMSLMLCGDYKAAAVKDALDFLMRVRLERKENANWFIYGHYYAAQAMYQAGSQGELFRPYWTKWYPDIAQTLVSRQHLNGPEAGSFQGEQPALWRTATCALILGIPYRYLPMYQR